MNLKKYKRKFKPYKIKSRKSTISNAFASAIAPYDDYDEVKLKEALNILDQNDYEDLTCVYCGSKANTLDHLVNLVKKSEFQGYGHQIGNLVPCCSTCNSKKRDLSYEEFILKSTNIKGNKKKLIERIDKFHNSYTKPVNVNKLKLHKKYMEYMKLKEKIINLLDKADSIAEQIRSLD